MIWPKVEALFAALEATWPSASARRVGPWKIREGRGGGQRVSSATAEAPVNGSDITCAEKEMSRLGQSPIFMIRPGEDRLDSLLENRGYRMKDPVAVNMARAATLVAAPLPPASVFHIYPPLGIMVELWADGDVGPERLAVMERVKGPKTALLARSEERPAGVGFVAIHGSLAVIHAIHVAPPLRRKGVGTNILRAAAFWARDRGVTRLALAATRANGPASALYASNDMKVLAGYHYRAK